MGVHLTADAVTLLTGVMLIIFGGLPGVGKTTIARELARQLDATYLRLDSIEQAIRQSNARAAPMNDAGYRVGYAAAEDNLRLGRTVVADSVNPLGVTRAAWRAVAAAAGVAALEVEVTCSDRDLHRQRVESRTPDIRDHQLPTWADVVKRRYDGWDRTRLVIDTATSSVEDSLEILRTAVAVAQRSSGQ
jgi:predicted kinase